MTSFSKSTRDAKSNKKPDVDSTPGPGQYVINDKPFTGVTPIKFKGRKPNIFSKKTDSPGPQYGAIREGIISNEKTMTSVGFKLDKRFKSSLKYGDKNVNEEDTNTYSLIDGSTKNTGKKYTFGKKLDVKNRYFSKYISWTESITPGPKYEIVNDFKNDVKYKPKSHFGTEERGKNSGIVTRQSLMVPGPGKYGDITKNSLNDHSSYSFGSSKRLEKNIPFNKLSETEYFGVDSPGPTYMPNLSQIRKNVKGPKIMINKSMKVRRTITPGPGNYSPKVMKMNSPTVTIGVRGKETVDIFTNSKRKARYIGQKQFGFYSPGPKYAPRLSSNSKKFTFPRGGMNVRPKKKKRNMGPKYKLNFNLVEKKAPKVKFTRGKRYTGTAKKDKNAPGPGDYYNPGLTSLSNTCFVKIKKGRKKTISKKGKDSPGVAKYNPKDYYNEKRYRKGYRFGGLRPMSYS